jgi:DNA transformation protein
MSTQQSTMDYLLDQLRHAGPVSCRKMFGEYCLYYDGSPVGLVCDDQFFLKPTEQGRALLHEVAEGAPFPGAKPHLRIDADHWEDAQALSLLVRTTALALPVRPPPKPKTKAAKVASPSGKIRAAASRASSIADLPNLGPKSAAILEKVGIKTLAQLRQRGAVSAYVAAKTVSPKVSLNLLWALEGALSGITWQEVARNHRTSLLLAVEQCELGLRE